MVCFAFIGMNSLVDRKLWSNTLSYPPDCSAQTDECEIYHTAYTTVSLRMNPRSWKPVETTEIKN
jgi:hypothetical protein